MNDPSRVRVSGPLVPYAPGFRAELEARATRQARSHCSSSWQHSRADG